MNGVMPVYQALYRKYRPRTFEEVVGQDHITDTLRRQVATGRLSHAYLFTGTRGTGKTTCAKILAKAVNCLHPVDGDPCNQCEACRGLDSGAVMDVLELDAASNNSVDYVRALRDEAVYSPANVKKRVYIVDEVHMLSTSAFNALLKILEEPPEHLMFILATTELHKVPATIKSRCQQFAFKRILPGDIAGRLKEVAGREDIPLTEAGADLLARLADGGMRDALSLLDQCVTTQGPVDENAILAALGMMGNLETAAIMEKLGRGDTAGALTDFARLYEAGKDVKTLLGELSGLARDLLIRKTAARGGGALLTGGYDDATLRGLSELLTAPRLLQMLTILQSTAADLIRSANPRTDGELCLIRLGDETLDGSAAGLSARVSRLETMMEYPMRKPSEPPARPASPAAGPAKRPPQPEPAADEAMEDAPPWEDVPPPEDDVPPWEPPVEPGAAADASQQSASHRPPAAEISLPNEEQAEGEDGAFWPALLPSLKGLLSPAVWPFVSNAAMTTASLRGDVLTLYAKVSVTKAVVDKPEILEIIAHAASARLGREIQVAVSAPEPKAGRLDDLLAIGEQFK